MKSLKKLLTGAVALLAILGLTSCFEESTVVKVNKDGSGVIHIRKYQNDQGAGGILGGLGGGSDEAPDEDKEPDGPTEAELKEQAASMGEGVTFKSLRKGKNGSGWSGYEAIFAFADINKLQLEMNMKDAEEMQQPDPNQEAPDKGDVDASELVRFEMKDGLLSIRTPDPSDDEAGEGEDEEQADPAGGAQDPFGDDPQGAQMMAMMAPMLAGAKVGFFIEIDGELAESNAKHRKGNMITIMRADLGKIFANPEALKKMEGLEGNDREEVQKIVDGIDGIDMDLQDPITVKFK